MKEEEEEEESTFCWIYVVCRLVNQIINMLYIQYTKYFVKTNKLDRVSTLHTARTATVTDTGAYTGTTY